MSCKYQTIEPNAGQKVTISGPQPVGLCRGPPPSLVDHDLNVLHGTGYKFLDFHAPKPSPPGAVKAVALGFCKGSLHEVLTGSDVAPALSAFAFAVLFVQGCLPFVAADRSGVFAFGALVAKLTAPAGFVCCLVDDVAVFGIISERL